MSEIIVYRSRIQAATDQALFDMLNSEWAFPFIAAFFIACVFYAFTSGFFENCRHRELLKNRGGRENATKIQRKWNCIEFGAPAAVFGVVLYALMRLIS